MRAMCIVFVLLLAAFGCQSPESNSAKPAVISEQALVPADNVTSTAESAAQAAGQSATQPVAEQLKTDGLKAPVLTDEGQGADSLDSMVLIPAGTYTMGSDGPEAEPHEGPALTVSISPFYLDRHEVTNKQFAAFVATTGYVTVAERPVDWNVLRKELPPGTPKPPAEMLLPGSLVFTPPNQAVPLHDYFAWWSWVSGADWRHPTGPASNIDGKDDFPVVQVAHEDALAYATWAGKRLPTEAEWEFAARGGKDGLPFSWGDELKPGGRYLANFFQGDFPHRNSAADGYPGAAPVGRYIPNAYGLYDMIGNVWEWTSDWYRPDTKAHYAALGNAACHDPVGPSQSLDPDEPMVPKRVIKGGSFLCSEQYCSNYRPSARMASASDTGQNHVGFRCAKDAS